MISCTIRSCVGAIYGPIRKKKIEKKKNKTFLPRFSSMSDRNKKYSHLINLGREKRKAESEEAHKLFERRSNRLLGIREREAIKMSKLDLRRSRIERNFLALLSRSGLFFSFLLIEIRNEL